MYFTGTPSSITESILPPNTTDELSNEFLDSVGIIFENYLCSYRKVKTFFFWGSDVEYSYGISVCICTSIFLSLHSDLLFPLKEAVSPLFDNLYFKIHQITIVIRTRFEGL